MDFMNRGTRNENANQQSANSPVGGFTPAGPKPKSKKFSRDSMALTKIGSLAFLIALTLLIAAAVFTLVTFKGDSRESGFVDQSKYQAVFLNGGQVYFGKISELNNKFAKVGDVFYLRVNQQVQPNATTSQNNDISLVKLGCELHGPQDSMIINRDQVVFWENLKDDGQVAKAVAKYKEQYPQGQNCDEQNASSTPAANNSTGTDATTTKPTTPTPTPTPSTNR